MPLAPPLNDERKSYALVQPPTKIVMVGGMHSGKSTAASVLVSKGWTHAKIADPIKQAAAVALNGADVALRKMGVKKCVVASAGWPDLDPMKDKDANRELFQFIGEYFRREKPSIWIDYFIQQYGHRTKIVVDDARLPLEVDSLHSRGYTVIKVVRPLVERIESVQKKSAASGRNLTEKQVKKMLKHDTEATIEDIQFDILIENDGSIYTLKDRINQVINNFREEARVSVGQPLSPIKFHPMDPRSGY